MFFASGRICIPFKEHKILDSIETADLRNSVDKKTTTFVRLAQ